MDPYKIREKKKEKEIILIKSKSCEKIIKKQNIKIVDEIL